MKCDVQDEGDFPFLSLKVCEAWVPVAERWGVSVVARGGDLDKTGFMEVYREAHGRKSEMDCFWRAKRVGFCKRHKAQIDARDHGLWRPEGLYKGLPTRQAVGLIMWAYHPEPERLAEALERWNELAKAKGWA